MTLKAPFTPAPASPPDATWLYEPFPAPDFSLPDLSHTTRSIAALKGKPAALLLTSLEPGAPRSALDKVAADPTAPNNNLLALRGIPNAFRIRVGDWRVSYTLDREARVMRVFEVAPRGGAYR